MTYGPIDPKSADKVVDIEMLTEHLIKEVAKVAVKRGADAGLPVPVAIQACAIATLQMVYDMASILTLHKASPNTDEAFTRGADWGYETLSRLVRTFDPEYRLPIITPRLDEKMKAAAAEVKP